MIDPSIFEAFQLATKPFTEDLDDGWKIVRAVCLIFLVITLVLWFFGYMTPEAPRFERAKEILNVSGWVTFIMFVFTYVACCLEVRTKLKHQRAEKLKKLDEFH